MRLNLIDRIDEISHGKYMVGEKHVTLGLDIFDEQFPGFPVFPAGMIQEGLSRLAGTFFQLTMEKQGLTEKYPVPGKVDKMVFRRLVVPGDKLIYRVEAKIIKDNYGMVAAKALLDGTPVAEGELTFVFIDGGNLSASKSGKDFHEVLTKSTKAINDKEKQL